MLGLWGSSDASNLRGQRWYVSRSSYSFHPLIHSGRMSWIISFTFLVQATQEFLDILLGLSVPSLPHRTPCHACHGISSLLRGPVWYTRRLQCLTFHLLPVSQHSLFVLFLPEPLYTPIAFFKLSNIFTEATKASRSQASCLPHLNAGLAITPLDHPHLRHNPRASSSLIGVHCRPSYFLPRWMLPIPVLPHRGGFLYRDS